MRTSLAVALAFCASTLLPQTGARTQDPGRVPAAALADSAPLFESGGFDGGPGTTWVSTQDWKAGFDQDGVRFVPFLGSDAPRDFAVALRLRTALVDGAALPLGDVGPTREAMHLRFARGAVIEDYEVRADGLEQSFRIDALPRRGAVRLELALQSDLEARLVDGEVHFDGPRGGVRYGRAFAFDAAGRRCDVETQLSGSTLALLVPAEFVVDATLPLTVDPLIGAMTTVASVNRQVRSVDLSWSESLQQYALCYERVWSATDSDVFVRILDAAMQPVGNTLVVDGSTTSWAKCAIASTETVAQQLIVAEVSNGSTSPYSVYGRMLVHSPAPVLNPAFAIAGPAHSFGENDATDPDVGGDPAGGTTYFGVVWASRTGLLDSDILFNQVTAAGTVRFANHVAIDTTRPIAITPRISKSDGQAPFATQGWAIVYRVISPSSNTASLRGAIVSWNGIPRSFGGSPSFEIDATDYHPITWDVSSPTDDLNGERRYVVAFEKPFSLATTIDGLMFDRSGNVISPNTILIGTAQGPESMRMPAIDCDGCRFTVAALRNLGGNEDATLMTTIDTGNGVFALVEGTDLSTTPQNEGPIAVVARHSGGGPRMDFGTAWARDLGAGNFVVEAQPYAARQPGSIATRTTHCGTVTIDTTGTPAVGVHFEVHAGGTGTVFGILAGLPTDALLPGCIGCRVGVSGNAFTTTALVFDIPCNYHLMGGVVSFQAFAVGGGSCLGSIGLSDTLDMTIR